MNRAFVPALDESAETPALTRPTSSANRLRGRLARLRLAWRRVATAAGAGLLAAGLTTAWLESDRTTLEREALSDPATASADSPPTIDADALGSPPERRHRPALDEDQRILALDRTAIVLPVNVGSVVEIVGLRPTVAEVQAEVITARAEVVGLTDEAILVAVDANAAYTAAEIAAVGRVTVLGRTSPTG